MHTGENIEGQVLQPQREAKSCWEDRKVFSKEVLKSRQSLRDIKLVQISNSKGVGMTLFFELYAAIHDSELLYENLVAQEESAEKTNMLALLEKRIAHLKKQLNIVRQRMEKESMNEELKRLRKEMQESPR